MHEKWIANRVKSIEVSGIRKVFELAAHLKDPVNLSIGQPHFPVPAADQGRRQGRHRRGQERLHRHAGHPRAAQQNRGRVSRRRIRQAGPRGARHQRHQRRPGAGAAVHRRSRRRGDPLRSLFRHVPALHHPGGRQDGRRRHLSRFPHRRRQVRGAHAADQGDHRQQPGQSDRRRLRRATLRDWPSWPTSATSCWSATRSIESFCYDEPFASPAEFNEDMLVFDGFSKAYGMTGWRLGFCHGPRRLIEEMIKLQQFTYRLRPEHRAARRRGRLGLRYVGRSSPSTSRKRDRMVAGSAIATRSRSRAARSTCSRRRRGARGAEFVAEAIRNNLLIIPGGTFSRRDTHFRLSYAASDRDAGTRHRDPAAHCQALIPVWRRKAWRRPGGNGHLTGLSA